MRRSPCPKWPELALALATAACAGAPPASTGPSLAFSHDDSVAQAWPFGLDDCTTKIVAEPGDPQDFAASYWVVRATRDGEPAVVSCAFTAQWLVYAEFEGTAFAPLRGVDFDIVTGVDPHGAATTEVEPGRFEVRVPVTEGARQSGFVLRARFPGDGDGQEPPKSLIVELVSAADASGRAIELGSTSRARWLIVDPDGGASDRAKVPADPRDE